MSDPTGNCTDPTPAAAEVDAIIGRIQGGDPARFDDLFIRFHGRVVRYLTVFCGSPTEAQDLAQETFIRAFRSLATYQPRGRFVNWLLTIARNLALNHRRRPDPALPASDRLEEAAAPGHRDDYLQEPLSQHRYLKVLKPTEREVLLLRVVEELPYDDIADITGLGNGALRKLVCQALARLREEHGRDGLPTD